MSPLVASKSLWQSRLIRRIGNDQRMSLLPRHLVSRKLLRNPARHYDSENNAAVSVLRSQRTLYVCTYCHAVKVNIQALRIRKTIILVCWRMRTTSISKADIFISKNKLGIVAFTGEIVVGVWNPMSIWGGGRDACSDNLILKATFSLIVPGALKGCSIDSVFHTENWSRVVGGQRLRFNTAFSLLCNKTVYFHLRRFPSNEVLLVRPTAALPHPLINDLPFLTLLLLDDRPLRCRAPIRSHACKICYTGIVYISLEAS